jgi:hypothetical protein
MNIGRAYRKNKTPPFFMRTSIIHRASTICGVLSANSFFLEMGKISQEEIENAKRRTKPKTEAIQDHSGDVPQGS